MTALEQEHARLTVARDSAADLLRLDNNTNRAKTLRAAQQAERRRG